MSAPGLRRRGAALTATADPAEPDLSIVLLAYDEEENVRPVLEELLAWLAVHAPSSEVVVVDDGSRDRTSARAAEALAGVRHRIERHETNRGIGAALKTGVRAARGRYVTFLPADGQIEPEAVGVLRAEAERTGADVVLSVYAGRDDGLARTVLSAGVRTLITVVHGVRLRSDGPYLFRRRLFQPDDLPPDTFFLNFEFPIRALASGLAVRTVTIRCRPRRAGVSKSARVGRALGVARDLLDMRWRRWSRAARILAG
ncbi:MAG: glycosyltransferase family 2 protein [Sandaracinaceae bacterium]